MSSDNGYYHSPYSQQHQQHQQHERKSSGHTPTSYAQQTNTSASQYSTNQLPSTDQSHAQSTPTSRAYETSAYPFNYDNDNRTETRSDLSQRGGSRSNFAGYAPTSRADDGSGYGSSSYTPRTARNDSLIADSARRSQVAQSTRESYGSTGGNYGTSYSRNSYTSQMPDEQPTTSSYQYPSTHTVTNIAHAAPYTRASQPSRGQSVRSPSMHNAITSQPVAQQVPQPVPTSDPRTAIPRQIYREDCSNLWQALVVSQLENVLALREGRGAQEPQAQPKKSRQQETRPAKTKRAAATKPARTSASNTASSSHNASSGVINSQRSPTTYASQSVIIIEDQPVTVDPSRVFNEQEYQRRKDAIEAEARAAKEAAEKVKEDARRAKEKAAQKAEEDARKAKEEAAQKAVDEARERAAAKEGEKQEAQKKAWEEEEARKRRITEEEGKKRANADEETRRNQAVVGSSASKSASTPHAQTVEGSGALASPTMAKDSPNADAIKSLFLMFNKIRELHAKDPTLFSKVWEDFKKTQPSIGGKATSQRPPALQGNQTAASIASPVLPSPSLLDCDALPNLSAALDSPFLEPVNPGPVEVDSDRGRFPAQRRKCRIKAELVADRAGSTESSGVALARDEAVAGLTKLQQAKASEDSQGKNAAAAVPGPSTSAAVPSQTARPGTQSSPPAPAAVPPTPPNSQVQSTAPNLPTAATKPPTASPTRPTAAPNPSIAAPSRPFTGAPPPQMAGRTAPTPVDVAMQEAMRAFHYPNPVSASQSIDPYRSCMYPDPARVANTSITPTPQPLSAHPPNPNLAHLSYSSHNHPNPVYAPYSSIRTSGGPAEKNVVWPESCRVLVAAAARDALMADPQNAGKLISADVIDSILGKQPSYVELCDILERQLGFVLDRCQFARSILGAVPPGKSAMHGVNSTKAMQQQAAPTPNVSLAPNGPAQRESTSKSKQKQPLSSPTEAKPSIATPPAEQGPKSKAEMARKRTFADLVDLTADSDEEDRIKRVKLVQLSNGPEAGSGSSHNAPPMTIEDMPPLLAPAAPKEPEKLDMSNLKSFTLSAAREALRTAEIAQPIDPKKARSVGRYNVKTLARDILITAGKHETEAPLNFHLFRLKDIYKHVNQTTDLSTLKWDIMDPGGPEPGTGLEVLQNGAEGMGDGEGEKVDADMVARLGGKSKATEKEKRSQQAQDDVVAVDSETERLGDKSMAKEKTVQQVRDDAVAVDTETEDKDTAAQTFELVVPPQRMIPSRGRGRPRGSGRLSRELDRAHLATHRHSALTPTSSPSAFLPSSPRRDLLIPAYRARGTSGRFSAKVTKSSPRLSQPNSLDVTRSKHFHTSNPNFKPTMPPTFSVSKNRIDQLSSPSAQTASSIRRSPTTNAIDAAAATPVSWQTSQTTPSGLTVRVPTSTPGSRGKRRGRPLGSLNRPKDEDATPKRRGRPVGSVNKSSSLRKAHAPPKDGLKVLVEPSSTNSNYGVKIYRDPNDSDGAAVDIEDEANGDVGADAHERSSSKRAKRCNQASPPPPSEPVYQVYRCEWQGCSAELHNLDTLRKHVFKLHYQEGDCKWADCGGLIGVEAGEEEAESFEHLRHHLERVHLRPLAWTLGDGPRVEKGGSDGERSASVQVVERANL